MTRNSVITHVKRSLLLLLAILLGTISTAHARSNSMHIMEGFLPLFWCIVWFIAVLPFWIVGIIHIRRIISEHPERRILLGVAGAFTFVLSALKLPSVTGSSSPPTGTGFGAVLFGPFVMSILGSIVLVFQALLIAHGGLTTLGANAFSMAVGGPLVAWGIYKAFKNRLPDSVVIFIAAALADLITYVITSLQLALAYPDAIGGVGASFVKFGTIFAITQIPLAISEGILTVLIFKALASSAPSEFTALGWKGA